jgi:hypothetical protein
MSVSFECCVLSGRGLCDRPITRPEEAYRVCVLECGPVQQEPSIRTEVRLRKKETKKG